MLFDDCPESDIEEYIVAHAESPMEISMDVEERLKEGFVPYGSGYSVFQIGEYTFCQPMVKYRK